MARQVDEHAREAPGVEVHRDCVPIPDFLDVVRLVSTWKPANPKISNRASTRSVSAAGALEAPGVKRSATAIAAREARRGEDHDPNHLTDGNGQSRVGCSCFRPALTVFGQCGNPAARKPSIYLSDILRSVVRPQFVLEIGNAQLGIELLQPLSRFPGFLQAPGERIARRRDAQRGLVVGPLA